MFRMIAFLMLLGSSTFAGSLPDDKAVSDAMALRDRGEFTKAANALKGYLAQTSSPLTAENRRAVEFEVERISRIRQDYTVTREKLLKLIQERVADFTDGELNALEKAGKLDTLTIDGQKRYANGSRSNLFMREESLRARQKDRKPDTTLKKLYLHMKDVKAARAATGDTLVLPQDLRVTYTLTVKPNMVEPGRTVRCWLPFVRAIPSQTGIRVLATDPPQAVAAQPEAAHRTLYLEKTAAKDQPVKFQAAFLYRCFARTADLDPAKVQPYRKDGVPAGCYAAERKPHVDFSVDELKRIQPEIASDGETNPLVRARRIYDWVARNCIYQYAREYSTIENLSAYTAGRRAGDCGQHGMLFIALCRLNGIPARWSTGWECFEGSGGNNMHDWCEFYVEPWGWIPADPDMAVLALHHGDGQLDQAQTRELVDWMFGNMDHFRLTVNGDFGAPLWPPKQDFRSETVDFQRGEVECDGRNLYFDKWGYTMEFEPISAEEARKLGVRGVQ